MRALAIAGVSAATAPALACDTPVGRIIALRGEAVVYDIAGNPRPALAEMPICAEEMLRTGKFATATVVLESEAGARPNLKLGATSIARINGLAEHRWWVELVRGLLYVFSRQPQSLRIETPLVTASVEGTEFLVSAEPARAAVLVYEGTVVARNPQGEASLGAGQVASVGAGEAPRAEIAVRPWDAVAWAIYYPPVLLLDAAGAPAGITPTLREAVALAGRGDVAGALAALEAAAVGDQEVAARVLRAAIMLSVGAVETARIEIDRALSVDPRAALAYALRSVIATAQNDRAAGLADAQQAVALAPSSAAAKIALSYAQQAAFQLDSARETMRAAVRNEPGNALAWARLAELWLAAGDRLRAREAAEKAHALAPHLDRVQTVLGFAYLVEIRIRRARDAFERAIALNSADPLPRFGLGLTRIRDGELGRGRAEIETAVALDPTNALFRSYLGIAYFEERTTDPLTYFRNLWERWPAQENALAASQFALAKELDPLDPTPWFYDAIRKQSENRPVEALRDLDRSIELNDNRAVYRSNELLNSDLAGRGASVARIYNDLGFEHLGINEATKSITLDPSNSAAHRFLSDLYATQPRREIARVSELLQAQLLQDVNINPVSPLFAQTNTGTSYAGLARLGLNEYTPLFDRNRAQLNLSGLAGSDYTRGSEAIVSGLYDNFSISGGYAYYHSDGFRQNFDTRSDTGNILVQGAITPIINLQAEAIVSRSEYGDRYIDFLQNGYLPLYRNDLDEDYYRVGGRLELSPTLNVIGSASYANRQLKGSHSVTVDINEISTKSDGFQAEGQIQYQSSSISSQVGGGLIDTEISESLYTRNDRNIQLNDDDQLYERNFEQIYAYNQIRISNTVTADLGFSFDHYEEPGYDTQVWNPKLGLTWTPCRSCVVRGAVFRAVRPPLAGDRTIMPTTVAGFNQLYDDAIGTKRWVYGVAAQAGLSDELTVGVEATRSTYHEPVEDPNNSSNIVGDNRDEDHFLAFINTEIGDRLAGSAGFEFDRFKSNAHSDPLIPERITSRNIPISLKYFDPWGFWCGITLNIIKQDVRSEASNQRSDNDDDARTVDLVAGYEFPQRRGRLALAIVNVFDASIKYQNDSFRQFRDFSTTAHSNTTTRFLPERTIIAFASLNF